MNRREMLASMAAAGAVVSVTAKASLPAQPDRKAWDAAWQRYQAAVAASDAYDAEYDRIDNAYKEALEKVPHTTIQTERFGKFSTASGMDVALARSDTKSIRYLEDLPGNYDLYRAKHQLVAAADARQATIAQLDERLGWTKANERWEALTDAISDAETVLLDMPAPDGEALMWKVQRLWTPGEGVWGAGVEDQTVSDLHRLLSIGRA